MKTYRIIVTPLAHRHLQSISAYIAYTLQAPGTAASWLDRMEAAIETLSAMPYSHPAMQEEPWRSENIRRMQEGNHFIYYFVVDEDATVHVIAVIYARRDQLKQLRELEL